MDISIRVIDKQSDDMTRVRSLYTQVFNDTERFTEYFFRNEAASSSTVILGAFIEKNIVSVMFLLEKSLIWNGIREKGCYIYGVATAPGYRGKGYMRRLMEYGLNYCESNKYRIIYLIPVDEKIYDGLGFVSVRKAKRVDIIHEENKAELMAAELSIGEDVYIEKIIHGDKEKICEASRFAMTADKLKGGIWEEKDVSYFCRRVLQAEAENAGIYIVRDNKGKIKAVIITGADEDMGICISEVICKGTSGEENMYVKMLAEKYDGVRPYILINPIMIYKWTKDNTVIHINNQV